ncbi:MAG TPA: SAM-dependent methyltransferase [Candidatus Tectomicrobia bacterium]|nr:SAM-dependent methyltransferase [Candidatus Tectomicrobia bacterium]
MAFEYQSVVPWGRSFEEYRRMFALTDNDLNLRMIGCADGPASFNAHMSRRGRRVVSCDPLYLLTAERIQERIEATYEEVIGQTRQNQRKFVWTYIKSPSELGQIRMDAMRSFLADYEQGRREGRYVAAELPYLPFEPASFDVALCSHFLFLYSDNLSLAFHQQAIEAMCTVAREARIFPLLTYNAEPSPFVKPLLERLAQAGYKVAIERVPYEFQRGGNKMLRVAK